MRTAPAVLPAVYRATQFQFSFCICNPVDMYIVQPPAPEESVNLHFIALVHKQGYLYELGKYIIPQGNSCKLTCICLGILSHKDGRKTFPINHGPTSPDSFLMVCKYT